MSVPILSKSMKLQDKNLDPITIKRNEILPQKLNADVSDSDSSSSDSSSGSSSSGSSSSGSDSEDEKQEGKEVASNNDRPKIPIGENN